MSKAAYMKEYRRRNADQQRKWWSEYRSRPEVRARRSASLRKSHLKRKFGLSPEQFESILKNQGGACKACGGPASTRYGFHVDHCHETGKIRGLLCHGCNTALGLVQESPARLRRLAEYLESA